MILLAVTSVNAQKKPAKSAMNPTEAFVNARTMYFLTTGPEAMRYTAKLTAKEAMKDGSFRIKVKFTAGATEMGNLRPGVYTYTVRASHAKLFFGQVRVGDRFVFVEIDGVDAKKPKWNNPTDYLRMEK